jgi:hypothetical protein
MTSQLSTAHGSLRAINTTIKKFGMTLEEYVARKERLIQILDASDNAINKIDRLAEFQERIEMLEKVRRGENKERFERFVYNNILDEPLNKLSECAKAIIRYRSIAKMSNVSVVISFYMTCVTQQIYWEMQDYKNLHTVSKADEYSYFDLSKMPCNLCIMSDQLISGWYNTREAKCKHMNLSQQQFEFGCETVSNVYSRLLQVYTHEVTMVENGFIDGMSVNVGLLDEQILLKLGASDMFKTNDVISNKIRLKRILEMLTKLHILSNIQRLNFNQDIRTDSVQKELQQVRKVIQTLYENGYKSDIEAVLDRVSDTQQIDIAASYIINKFGKSS